MARILITGAAGFIGQALCARLAAEGHTVVGAARRADVTLPPGVAACDIGEIGPVTDWRDALRGVDLVFHLAQQAHRAADARFGDEPAAAARLAEAAAAAGAGRLVYLSSVKVMGESTSAGRPFRPNDEPRPQDAYGRAKLATERALTETAARAGLELVVIRPPLVYGPGVKANFRALIALANSGLPLPFAAIDNRRSLIFLDNLVDLAIAAAFHPGAAGKILLARDDIDLSTPQLVRQLAAARPLLLPIPRPVLSALLALPGLGRRLRPLVSSLQIDDTETRETLGWTPPVGVADGLARTAAAFARR